MKKKNKTASGKSDKEKNGNWVSFIGEKTDWWFDKNGAEWVGCEESIDNNASKGRSWIQERKACHLSQSLALNPFYHWIGIENVI